ncbi:MAG: hypothetical protein IJ174_08355 [Clostridia bacterium]|nr:hypothetical protein [Clostridia bacterium]
MKKILGLALSFALLLAAVAGSAAALDVSSRWQEADIDLDLSKMSGTVVYAQIFQLISDYQAYEGKIIRMRGWYDGYQDRETGMVYLSCIIPDATACCAQGIEFVWAGEHTYPDDFPAPGTGVTVTGRFETYMEGEYMYVHLADADVVWETEAAAE